MVDTAQVPQATAVPAASPLRQGMRQMLAGDSATSFTAAAVANPSPSLTMPAMPTMSATSVVPPVVPVTSVAPAVTQSAVPADSSILSASEQTFLQDLAAVSGTTPAPTNSLAAAVPLAVAAATDTLNPANPAGGAVKEVREPGLTLEKPAVDQIPGVQYVEQERAAEQELPPEVDGFLKEVESHHDQAPHEVVIADDQGIQPTTKYLAQPVVILPITPEVEKQGQKQSPQFSIRWLVEWSHKVMKMFSGKVIYREA
jgi:hypothetical protein